MGFCTQNDSETDATVLTVCVGYSVNDILLDPSNISNKKGDLSSKRETNAAVLTCVEYPQAALQSEVVACCHCHIAFGRRVGVSLT